MTSREEVRDRAIEVMDDAYEDALHAGGTVRDTVTAALDALGASGFKVVGPEVTEEMASARRKLGLFATLNEIWEALSVAGDLTRKRK